MKTIQIEIVNSQDFLDKIDKMESKLDSLSIKTPLEKTWLTNKEVATILRVTFRTLQNYRDRNLIPFSQVGSKIYYRASDIQKHLDDNYVVGRRIQ